MVSLGLCGFMIVPPMFFGWRGGREEYVSGSRAGFVVTISDKSFEMFTILNICRNNDV